ncbi:MAG: molybdopterin molybdotransferase MoeA [Hadesarchaea archaeon]|nr:molybdopterin molybdotransferase MoeA [Hadesarchaea archaeon]
MSDMSVRMKGFSSYTRLEEALDKILSRINSLQSETIPINQSLNRVLYEDIESEVNIPPFDRSAMDGYAVRASDTFGADENNPIELKVIGSSDIGTPPEDSVGEGEAIEIMTGAVMPEGADAVIMIEHTEREDNKLEIYSPVSPGKNVSDKGEDVKSGEKVLSKGKKLRPQDVGMLAATSHTEVKVFSKPKVGIVATGVELREPGEELDSGEITESNSYSLEAAVNECGGEPDRLKITPDEPSALRETVEKASDFDMLLISGSTSVGKRDLIPEIISELGELIIHGVAIRPGGPTAFGIVDGVPVFALAGFPVASFIAFETLSRPALRFMQGLPGDRGRPRVEAKLKRKVSSTLGRADVVRVKLDKDSEEQVAEPIRVTGSSVLSSLTRADGYAIIPEDVEGFDKGIEVEIELFC